MSTRRISTVTVKVGNSWFDSETIGRDSQIIWDAINHAAISDNYGNLRDWE